MKKDRKFKAGTERAIRLSFRTSESERNNLESARVLLQKQTGKKVSLADAIAFMSKNFLSLNQQQ